MSMILLERRALRTALNDAESAINRLGHAATGVLYFVLFIAGFLIFNVDPGQVLLTTSSFLLASAFAIGDTAKSLLQSILFIFSTHPFDIGDRVMIDGACKCRVLISHLCSVHHHQNQPPLDTTHPLRQRYRFHVQCHSFHQSRCKSSPVRFTRVGC